MSNRGRRTPGQQKLLQGVRLLDNKDMGDIIKESSIDDLEWFLQMVEYQLEETPHWIKDPDTLQRHQAWDRRVRTMTTEILHNKRIAARPWLWLRQNGGKVFWIVAAVAIGFFVRDFLE